jgi:hypothetical protein
MQEKGGEIGIVDLGLIGVARVWGKQGRRVTASVRNRKGPTAEVSSERDTSVGD